MRKTINSYSELLFFYMFITPWLIGFLLFILYPLIMSIWYSFTRSNILETTYIGLGNYSEIFQDPIFYHSIIVTLKYTLVSVPINTLASLTIAILLNQNIKFLSFWRTIYYLPSVLSGVAVAILWKWIMNPEFGLINSLLFSYFKIEGPRWFYSEEWVIPSYWIMGLWQIGGTLVIFLAGLQTIPTTLYEAAKIDGANDWQKFVFITVPLITPVLLFTLITNLIYSLRIFTQVFVISEQGRGGPNNASLFYMLYLYQNGFQWGRYGYASALAVILFIITFIASFFALRAMRDIVYYNYNDN